MPARYVPMSLSKVDRARDRIRATHLIDRLQAHVMGLVALESSQIRAAEILLKKVMPDLQATELSTADGNPVITFQWATHDAPPAPPMLEATEAKVIG